MALKNWGPLTAKQKQEKIAEAFDACIGAGYKPDMTVMMQQVYYYLLKQYKMNQTKFSDWQTFWHNKNYEKHLNYLQGLVDAEVERRGGLEYIEQSTTKTSASKQSLGYADTGSAAENTNWMTIGIVAVVVVIAVLLVRKFKKR